MELLICSQIFTVSSPKPEFDDVYNEFSKRSIINSPIITFYGRTREGGKAAVHVHKVRFI